MDIHRSPWVRLSFSAVMLLAAIASGIPVLMRMPVTEELRQLSAWTVFAGRCVHTRLHLVAAPTLVEPPSNFQST